MVETNPRQEYLRFRVMRHFQVVFSGWKWMILYVGFCWQNMQQTLNHESYTATWYGSCKRRRGQYMPTWLIPVPGDSSKPLKALRYCFRVWRVNSGCKTHAQPGWCFHVCRLFSSFSLSCWSSSMRPESFHVDNHFASENSQRNFQGWEATRRKLLKHIIRFIWIKLETPLEGYVFYTFPLPVHFAKLGISMKFSTNQKASKDVWISSGDPPGLTSVTEIIMRASNFLEHHLLHLLYLRQDTHTTTFFFRNWKTFTSQFFAKLKSLKMKF